jgi:hypothetical protein
MLSICEKIKTEYNPYRYCFTTFEGKEVKRISFERQITPTFIHEHNDRVIGLDLSNRLDYVDPEYYPDLKHPELKVFYDKRSKYVFVCSYLNIFMFDKNTGDLCCKGDIVPDLCIYDVKSQIAENKVTVRYTLFKGSYLNRRNYNLDADYIIKQKQGKLISKDDKLYNKDMWSYTPLSVSEAEAFLDRLGLQYNHTIKDDSCRYDVYAHKVFTSVLGKRYGTYYLVSKTWVLYFDNDGVVTEIYNCN